MKVYAGINDKKQQTGSEMLMLTFNLIESTHVQQNKITCKGTFCWSEYKKI